MLPSPCHSVTRSISQEDCLETAPFFARPSSLAEVCILHPSDWRDELHLWSKCLVIFDVAQTDFNSRQFKSQMKTMAAQNDFRLLFNAFLPYLKIGTFVLIMAILINDNATPGARDSSDSSSCTVLSSHRNRKFQLVLEQKPAPVGIILHSIRSHGLDNIRLTSMRTSSTCSPNWK